MYNYYNLNDVDFEELCKDIMERKLNTNVRSFAKGKDGGIDLFPQNLHDQFFIQVKHYLRSPFSTLKSSLKKEIQKVKNHNPDQYYLCICKELTPKNIEDIFFMFSEYMESTENIVTLKEIDDFLQKEENKDIVNKHYKLWLESSGILSQMFNRDMFIDCEMLFADIEEEKGIYVQTEAFNKSLMSLKKNRILMIVGAPGVGKTVTSKMILLKMASLGYRARYTTNGNLSDIKRSLSIDPDQKEIILLDDCLGQHYFNMKDTIESELISIINYIRMHPSKLLIMNSRVTILNEAKDRSSDFEKIIDDNKINQYILDMDKLSIKDRARILYNHFYAQNIPNQFFNEIKLNGRYRKIVTHLNYSPRIVEYVTRKSFYSELSPEEYYPELVRKFDYPDKIWKEELERRHGELERQFMFILYSITDNSIEYTYLKKAFEKRVSLNNSLDTSYSIFERVIIRLNGSLVKIVDNGQEKKRVSVINPSVNDYLRDAFYSSPLEIEKINNSAIHFEQIKRCNQDIIKRNTVIENKVISLEILDFDFQYVKDKLYSITYFSLKHGIMEIRYWHIIREFIVFFGVDSRGLAGVETMYELAFKQLFEKKQMFDYYHISSLLSNFEALEELLLGFNIEHIGNATNRLWKVMLNERIIDLGNIKKFECVFISSIEKKVELWINELSPDDLIDDFDLREIIESNTEIISEDKTIYNSFYIELEVEDQMKESIEENLDRYLREVDFLNWDNIVLLVKNTDVLELSGDDIIESVIGDFEENEPSQQLEMEIVIEDDTGEELDELDVFFNRTLE